MLVVRPRCSLQSEEKCAAVKMGLNRWKQKGDCGYGIVDPYKLLMPDKYKQIMSYDYEQIVFFRIDKCGVLVEGQRRPQKKGLGVLQVRVRWNPTESGGISAGVDFPAKTLRRRVTDEVERRSFGIDMRLRFAGETDKDRHFDNLDQSRLVRIPTVTGDGRFRTLVCPDLRLR